MMRWVGETKQWHGKAAPTFQKEPKMSKERMLDLRNLLCASGWEVSGRSGDCSPADALFSVENEMVKWIISKKGLQVGLLFQLSGDLGKRTRDLRDVFYCDAVGHDVRLYFSKINTGVWKTESRAFVDAIDRIADEQDALY